MNTAKTASGLQVGEPYLITDEGRVAVGTAVNNYVDYAKKSEVDAKQPLDADLTAIGALTGTAGLLKKTAAMRPIGTPMRIAPNVAHTDVKIIGRIP